MITPQQLPNPQVKPKWHLPVGVMESIVAYNCKRFGFPRPVLALPMWEGAGNRALDYSGHGNHGDLINGPDWAAEGVLFNSSTENIKGPNGAILSSVGTIIFGYKKTIVPTDWYYWCVLDDDYSEFAIDALASTGSVDFRINGSIVSQAGCTWIDGAYHNVASTWNADSNERKIYDNGSLFMSKDDAFTWDAAGVSDHYLRIGGRATGVNRYAGGIIYYFYVFNTALTAAQVKFLHDNQIPEELYGYVAAAAGTDVYLTLAQYSGIAGSGQAVAQGPVTLSNTLAALDGGAANALAPVTLSDILSVAGVGTMSTPQALALSKSLGVAESGQVDTQAAATLSNVLSLTVGAEAVAQSTITLAEILATLQVAATPSAGLIDSPNKRRSVAGIPAIPNNQIYGRDKQQIAGLYRGSFEYVPGALSLNEVIAVTSAGQAAASSDVTLSKVLTILQTYLAESNRSISLAEVLTAALSSEATAGAFITFAEDLALSQILTASQAASAAATSQLSLNNILSITVLAEALASAGIALNMVEVITTDGTVAVSVVTPDGRTITIAVEVRTVIVAEEVRTAIVAEEDRTVIIT